MDELISRQAAIDTLHQYFADGFEEDRWWNSTHVLAALKALPSAQQWIPVRMRPMDSEERAYWSEHLDFELSDEDAVMFDCKMPDDGQEILVSYRKWVCMDKCEVDGGCYGLEGNGDWDGVIAWMPLPAPWEGGES